MKTKLTKLISLLLAGLMLLPALFACGDTEDGGESQTELTVGADAETDPVEDALNELRGEVDWGGEDFGILYVNDISGYTEEVEAQAKLAGDSSNTVINDAVFERNTLFEEYCNLNFVLLPVSQSSFSGTMNSGVQSGTRDFYLLTETIGGTANSALSGYLYNYLDLDIDYEKPWWDAGTLEFALDGRVFFMNGPFNIVDDDVTFVMMFNKELQLEYKLESPYTTVKNGEWTLDYFNSIISDISVDNGDGVWDSKDIYGLSATGNIADSFFYGAGLQYVVNSRDMITPELVLDSKMEQALNVLAKTRSIIRENNSTYLATGVEVFVQGRALFCSEVVSYLRSLNASMEGEYGVLPIPKYNKEQTNYYAWSHSIGSTLSIPTSAAQNDMDQYARVLEVYCLLSQKLVKPAYYEVTLMTRNVQDVESAEMLDIVFKNRIYDMAAYFGTLNLSGLFSTAATGTSDNFSSKYASASKSFNKRVNNLLKKLQKNDT